MITGRTHTELMQVRDTMRDVLTEAAKHRHKREYVSGTGPHAELGWVVSSQGTHSDAIPNKRQAMAALKLDIRDYFNR